MPHTASIVDDIAIVKSLNTEAINHDPAITFIQTGSQQPGRPSLGAWLCYGLGSESKNLPAFVVHDLAGQRQQDRPADLLAPLGQRLPAEPAPGRPLPQRAPTRCCTSPTRAGIDADGRRSMLDGVGELNEMAAESFGDPEINTRIAQYEMAFRMQTTVPS